jgi:hypothetical protein
VLRSSPKVEWVERQVLRCACPNIDLCSDKRYAAEMPEVRPGIFGMWGWSR